jgi:hypothetical protein
MNVDTREWAGDLSHRYEESRDGVQNTVGLWRSDAFINILDYFQIYALLLLLACQEGTFPENLVHKSYFTFVANLDFWAIQEHADFDIALQQPQPSDVVTETGAGMKYKTYIAVWSVVPAILFLLQFAAERVFLVDDELVYKRRIVTIRQISFNCAQAIVLPSFSLPRYLTRLLCLTPPMTSQQDANPNQVCHR